MAKKLYADEHGELKPLLADEMIQTEYPPFFKTPWNHDTLSEAKKSATYCPEPTKTQQAPREQTDITYMLELFGIDAIRQAPPHGLVEVDNTIDMKDAITRVRAGYDAWLGLPENVKQHFETMDNYIDYVDQALARGDTPVLQKLNLVDAPPDPVKPTEEPVGKKSPKSDTPAPRETKEPASGSKD